MAIQDSNLEPLPFSVLRVAAARDVSVQLVPRSFSAKLTAKLFGTVGSEIGVAFAREIATISGERGLDAYGGIQTLGQVADTRGLELVILIEDTDAFVADADEGEGQPRPSWGASFFHLGRVNDQVRGLMV